MKKVTVCFAALLILVVLAACRAQEPETVSGTYSRENANGFDHFTITLNEDGTYSYFETMISSHLGMGEYTYEDGIVTLIDDQIPGLYGSLIHTYKFRYADGKLFYLAGESDGFMYVDLPDGAQFDRRETPALPTE